MTDDSASRALLQAMLRLGSRLRHERPTGALSSNKLGVLSHLRRHGPSTPSAIAAAEHQQLQSLTRTSRSWRRMGSSPAALLPPTAARPC